MVRNTEVLVPAGRMLVIEVHILCSKLYKGLNCYLLKVLWQKNKKNTLEVIRLEQNIVPSSVYKSWLKQLRVVAIHKKRTCTAHHFSVIYTYEGTFDIVFLLISSLICCVSRWSPMIELWWWATFFYTYIFIFYSPVFNIEVFSNIILSYNNITNSYFFRNKTTMTKIILYEHFL